MMRKLLANLVNSEKTNNLRKNLSMDVNKVRITEMGTREEGSITPLITLYFTLAMLAIFVIANVASTYVARRDLINLTEAALSKAAQELDEFVYYYQVPTSTLFGEDNQLVPINCSDAGRVFYRELQLLNTKDYLAIPEITDFQCNGRMLRAEVRQEHLLPFATKFLKLESYTNRISVTIVSQYR